jgi:hypothetical protein
MHDANYAKYFTRSCRVHDCTHGASHLFTSVSSIIAINRVLILSMIDMRPRDLLFTRTWCRLWRLEFAGG